MQILSSQIHRESTEWGLFCLYNYVPIHLNKTKNLVNQFYRIYCIILKFLILVITPKLGININSPISYCLINILLNYYLTCKVKKINPWLVI